MEPPETNQPLMCTHLDQQILKECVEVLKGIIGLSLTTTVGMDQTDRTDSSSIKWT